MITKTWRTAGSPPEDVVVAVGEAVVEVVPDELLPEEQAAVTRARRARAVTAAPRRRGERVGRWLVMARF
jgi:hypothetical protein